MTTHLLNDRLTTFLLNLECLDIAGQKDAFMNEVIECGGSYVPPADAAQSSHLFEIALHGVNAYGGSEKRRSVTGLRQHGRMPHWARPDARASTTPINRQSPVCRSLGRAWSARRARPSFLVPSRAQGDRPSRGAGCICHHSR